MIKYIAVKVNHHDNNDLLAPSSTQNSCQTSKVTTIWGDLTRDIKTFPGN